MPMRKSRRRIKKLQALSLDPTVDLWAMDEVHFQQHGSRCRMWVPPETKDPVLLLDPTRKSMGHFGLSACVMAAFSSGKRGASLTLSLVGNS